jgi:outer membrane lipase/esterase
MAEKLRESRGWKRALVCGAALWVASSVPGYAQSFGNFYVFGDSLSDAGTFRSPAAPSMGLRFTTNPGQEWNQFLGAMYGISVSPYEAIVADPTFSMIASQTVLGGTNYAQGGACVTGAYSATCPMNPLNTLGVTQQIATYLASTGGRANSGALYSVYGGGNDVLSQLQFVSAGTTSPTLAVLSIQASGAAEAANVGTLVAAGARFVLAPNLPDVGKTPLGIAVGAQGAALATALSSNFNASLNAGLQSIGGSSIIYVDINHLANEVISSPSTYGLVNATSPACTTSTSLICSPATLVAPNANLTYVFADDVHPTTAMQMAEAQYIASILSAPGKVALLPETSVLAERVVDQVLDQRTLPTIRSQTGWTIFGDADVTAVDVTPGSSAHASTTGGAGHLGVEYGAANGLRVGTLSSYSDGTYSFSGSSGRYGQSLFTQTVYGVYDYHGAFAQVSATIGRLNFDDVRRVTTILTDTRIDSGKPGGFYAGGRLLVGYDHHVDNVVLTPLASLTEETATVDAYNEGQGDSTAMSFGEQRRRLFVGGIGGRVSTATTIGGSVIEPQLTVMFNDDMAPQKRSVTAGVIGAPVTFAMPVTEPGHTWTTISAGIHADLGQGVSLSLGGGDTVGQTGASSAFGTLGLSYHL